MQKALRASDLEAGRATEVTISGVAVAVFNVGGTFHAIENKCPHRGGPLSEGFVEGTEVSCPWHNWTFDLASGSCINAPGLSVRHFPVHVEDGDVLVDVPLAGAALRSPRPSE